MSILTDLRTALEAYRHTVTMLRAELGVHFVPTRIRERDMARERLAELLIEAAPALLDVAEAAITLKAAIYAPEVYALDDDFNALDAALAPLVKEVDHE